MTLGLLACLLLLDWLVLYTTRNPVAAERLLPERLSNGEENTLGLEIANNYSFSRGSEIVG